MTPVALLAAGLAGAAATLVGGSLTTPVVVTRVPPPQVERAPLRRLRPLLAAVAAAGGWAMVGGPAGTLAGLLCGAVVWVVLGRGEEPAVVRRRERLLEELPLGVDLLAACLDAGAAPESALETVAHAVGGPVAEEFLGLHHLLEVGADPVQVWRSLAQHPQLAPLGRAVTRAHESGASVSRAMHQLCAELGERRRAEVEARARSIEVKASAPLGLCLLPAFVLLGVVPMVAGVFASMELFR
ncbi:MAG TPA: type II secretion system F family protein [Solirubrobacteraceae bacterium]